MPHIIVKLWPGHSEQEKQQLADAITQAAMRILHTTKNSLSVAIEEVAPGDWMADVYEPDILAKPEASYKQPGYTSI